MFLFNFGEDIGMERKKCDEVLFRLIVLCSV